MLLILDFNPCSPCGERQTWAAHRPRHKDFNPCSPCGERPAKAKKLFESGMKISIHAPRAGSDDPGPLKASWIQYFNPCSPCGERPDLLIRFVHQLYFNPCSPCGERLWLHSSWREAVQFQSMLPVRGATPGPDPAQPKILISIHAPRAGSDQRRSHPCYVRRDFNPCSPCGERRSSACICTYTAAFQSMLPVRGATVYAGS